jgi:hypothetical protein
MTLPGAIIDGGALLDRAVSTIKTAFVAGAAFFSDRAGANALHPKVLAQNKKAFEPQGSSLKEGVARLAQGVRETLAN